MAKKKKSKVILVPCHVYKANFYFFFGWDFKDYQRYLDKEFDIIVEGINDSDYGVTNYLEDCGRSIWLRSKPNNPERLAQLSHEIFHAVSDLMRKRGMKLNTGSEEAYAYMQEFLMREALSQLKNC